MGRNVRNHKCAGLNSKKKARTARKGKSRADKGGCESIGDCSKNREGEEAKDWVRDAIIKSTSARTY